MCGSSTATTRLRHQQAGPGSGSSLLVAQARSGHAQSLRDMISELDSLVARAQQEQAALMEQQG